MTRAEPMATETTFHRYLIYIIYLDVQDDMRHVFTFIVKYAYQFLTLNYSSVLLGLIKETTNFMFNK